MPLTKKTESRAIYLQVKHFCLWMEIKKRVDGCEAIEVTNPKTKEVLTKFGYAYRSVSGRVVKIARYDTADKYSTRYFGFKVHFQDDSDLFVLDMPYQSQILRRFLRVARNIDWLRPLTITIFKGKGEGKKADGETGVWFQQGDDTIKPYYTREAPRGMPTATQDPDTHEWDFKAQHRWLIDKLQAEIIPDVEHASHAVPPMEPESDASEPEPSPQSGPPWEVSDDDVPF